MVDKSVLVTSGNGGQTVFAAVFNSKHEPTGKFEAPPGDSNLTMTLEENDKTRKSLLFEGSGGWHVYGILAQQHRKSVDADRAGRPGVHGHRQLYL